MSQVFNMENPMITRASRSKRSALTDISNNTTKVTEAEVTKVVKPETRRRSSRNSLETTVAFAEPATVKQTTTNNSVRLTRAQASAASAEQSDLDTSSSSIEVVGRLSTSSTGSKSSSKSRRESESGSNKKRKVESSSSSSAAEVIVAAVVQSEAPVRRMVRNVPPLLKSSDPAQCLDMIDNMYTIYYDLESTYTPGLYMANQEDINTKMRSILVDWLVEVHHKFKLQTLTLWLCVNILDRYLEATQVRRTKLQLVGVTALLIASKYEDVYAPEVKDCVYITDYAYDREEILQMEASILNTLQYQIFVPTGYHFLQRYMNAINVPERIKFLACYYAERNLQEYDTLRERPHVFAASALYAALMQSRPTDHRGRDIPAWGRALTDETGLAEHHLLKCSRLIVQHVSEEPETASKRRLIAAKKKYSLDKFLNVATLALPTI